MKNQLKVAVVGGGWAGLAAAVELCAAGAQVTVFEAARQLGGRARSVKIHGHWLDNGQHILIGAYSETLRLMKMVGADSERVLKRLALELHHPAAGFRLKLPQLPAPLHLALGLLAARGCGGSEKIAAVRFMRALQADDYHLASDCTVAELLDQYRQSGRLRRHLWEPLCLAALNTAPDNASAQIFANVLRDSLGGRRADTDLLLPAADLSRLFPQAAAAFIAAHSGEIRLSSRVDAIAPGLRIGDERFERIVLASAPQHVAPVLAQQPECAAIATLLASYAYEPIGTIYAGYPPETRLPCPMLGLASASGESLGQWAFDRGTLGGAHGVIGFVLSARGAWDERDDAALASALHGELEQALGSKLPGASWHQVIRERRATFSCRPHLPRPSAQTPVAGLWLAGDYVCADYPATLEAAVRSGAAAAAGALRALP